MKKVLTDDDTTDVDSTGGHPTVPRAASPTAPARNRPALARLVCLSGDDLGRAFPIGAELVLGRGSQASANLRAGGVSRRHARIYMTGDGFMVEDLGSTNGTFVNGLQVAEPTPIQIGDRLQLGDGAILVLTRQDELEVRMRQLQALEAMEQAVGGLAHDFNNALTVIIAGLDHAARLPPGDPELADVIGEAQSAAFGASELAKRLMHFRQREEVAEQIVGLAVLARDTIAMARRVTTTAITFEVNIAASVAVRASPDELLQVLLNLCLNARDAMPHGGTLTITAAIVRLSRSAAAANSLRAEGDYVELVVTDTGTGMSEATLARAFEPFFTTKPAGQGTGLGLSMVHNIIRRYGGAIDVESTPGRGTTFRIWLPSAGA